MRQHLEQLTKKIVSHTLEFSAVMSGSPFFEFQCCVGVQPSKGESLEERTERVRFAGAVVEVLRYVLVLEAFCHLLDRPRMVSAVSVRNSKFE